MDAAELGSVAVSFRLLAWEADGGAAGVGSAVRRRDGGADRMDLG